MEVSAVIVARGGSRRLAGKNLLLINGETLLARKIRQLQGAEAIHRVVVGSEDPKILDEAVRAGAEAIERPAHYCDESSVTANEMIGNMISLFQTDLVVWAHCTNPLLSSHTYDRAIRAFFDALNAGFDSLISVFEMREHLWGSDRKPFNYNPYGPAHPLASTLSPLYAQDGGIFIQPHEQMKKNSYFFGKSPFLFEIPAEEVMDINTPHEFSVAKAFIESVESRVLQV